MPFVIVILRHKNSILQHNSVQNSDQSHLGPATSDLVFKMELWKCKKTHPIPFWTPLPGMICADTDFSPTTAHLCWSWCLAISWVLGGCAHAPPLSVPNVDFDEADVNKHEQCGDRCVVWNYFLCKSEQCQRSGINKQNPQNLKKLPSKQTKIFPKRNPFQIYCNPCSWVS